MMARWHLGKAHVSRPFPSLVTRTIDPVSRDGEVNAGDADLGFREFLPQGLTREACESLALGRQPLSRGFA